MTTLWRNLFARHPIEYYKKAPEEENVPGLMHVNFGGYHISDIKFVTAFEVNKRKIGRDLGKAIFMEPNACAKFAEVPNLNVKVLSGPILDGVAPHMRESFQIYNEKENT
jgi:myo-inositol-1-phosphate synthase